MHRIVTLLIALTAFGECSAQIAAAKDVTILVIMELNAGRTGPPYNDNIRVSNVPDDATLFDVMKQAENNGNFRFDYTEHPTLGAYITTINGLQADPSKKQYWQILGGPNMEPIPLGASSYVPSDGENVLFRLVTWDSESHPTEEDNAVSPDCTWDMGNKDVQQCCDYSDYYYDSRCTSGASRGQLVSLLIFAAIFIATLYF